MNDNMDDFFGLLFLTAEEEQTRRNSIDWAVIFVSKMRQSTDEAYRATSDFAQRKNMESMKKSLVIFESILCKLVEENEIYRTAALNAFESLQQKVKPTPGNTH